MESSSRLRLASLDIRLFKSIQSRVHVKFKFSDGPLLAIVGANGAGEGALAHTHAHTVSRSLALALLDIPQSTLL